MARQSAKSILEGLILDLNSNDETKIIGAIEKIPTHGSAELIEPMLECYDETDNEEIKEKIHKILSELKDTSCIDPLVDYFRIAEKETREMILNAFWNNNLSPITYIDVFVDAAIKGSYLEAFETLTLLENLEFDSDMDTKNMVLDIDDKLESDMFDKKTEILIEIKRILEPFAKIENDKKV